MEYKPVTSSDVKALEAVIPAERLSRGPSNLDLHAKDQSKHPPHRPEMVIWPESAREVSKVLAHANDQRIPVTAWGAGSSLEGNPIPVRGGIVLDFTRMNRILDIREEDFQVDVEPGVVYQDLNHELRHAGLFFPPDPGARATLGGMIANNASGTKTVHYGSTRDYVRRLSVVLADGQIIKTGTRAAKTSSGYDLINLFTGSEGTLGIVVKATLRLVGRPEEFSAVLVTFESVSQAAKVVREIVKSGLDPTALELLAPECITLINREMDLGLIEAPTLLMEYSGLSRDHIAQLVEFTQEICSQAGSLSFQSGMGRAQRDRIFEGRHQLGEMIMRNHPDSGVLTVDVAVPNSAYPRIIALARKEGGQAGLPNYTLGHAGDGNIHLNLIGRNGNAQQWRRIEAIAAKMVEHALAVGGTATGEHGVGIGKRRFMPQEHGDSLAWMQKIKGLFDPHHILNPGKIFL